MSRHWPDSDVLARRHARALIVAEYGPEDVTAIEYLRRHPLR